MTPLLGVVSPHLEGDILRAILVNVSPFFCRLPAILVNLVDFSIVFSQF